VSKFKNIGSWNSAKQAAPAPAPAAPAQSNNVGGGKLIEGDLHRIRKGRKQYRSYTEEEHILQLMASIREHGFSGSLPVIAVVDDDAYDYEYLGGHTTGEALKRLGHNEGAISR
jgi:hypothetical protein